jgi:uncharacterized protein
MAVTTKTPGVFIEEISVFPPSVAPVATAIPAFIGYTEKGPLNTPTRITSLLEYEQTFGGPFPEPFAIGLSGTVTNTAIALSGTLSEFTLYYNLRMYFANGGGPCYIVSADYYTNAPIASAKLDAGIGNTEKADEVTLLVIPEAVASTVSSAQRATLHTSMLNLCNKLKDRFALMDVIATTNIFNDANLFRSTETGNGNLKYGAAYYPALDTILSRHYVDSALAINDARTIVAGTTFGNTHKLSDVFNGTQATATVTLGSLPGIDDVVDTDFVTINGVQFVAKNPTVNVNLNNSPYDFLHDTTNALTAVKLRDAINSHTGTLSVVTAAIDPGALNVVIITAKVVGSTGNAITIIDNAGTVDASAGGTLLGGINPDKTLYNNITASLLQSTLRLYPSSTLAGIYASVDRDRGVWKSPANVSISGVIAPSVNISSADQEILNVDAGSGKSINAIRAFAGKGNLVWGARTLAGNDNEWRYVSVRRLFIFAEESIQKASEFVVFEPNDKNTWTKVKGLISNFLTNLWRDGALAGATPKDAFYVKCGLGETMTSQDILEGKLIIQVGLAAVRPAEFIVLQFMHKLQES